MKKILFFFIIFIGFFDISHSEWYGGSIYNGALNGYHNVSYGSNTGLTSCPNDGQGANGARVHPSYTDMNAGTSGAVRCQWWDGEAPSSSTSQSSVWWVNNDIYITLNSRDNGGSGLDEVSYTTGGSTNNNRTVNPTGNTDTYIIRYTVEGEHNLSVSLTDEVGLTDNSNYGPYRIDKNPPTAPSLSSPGSSHPNGGIWYSDDTVEMNINMNGEGPSPAENLWCFDSTNTCTPNQNIGADENMTVSKGDGVWFFRAMTRDVGGTGPISSFRVQIDISVGTPTASQNAYPGGSNWSNTNTSINLLVSDANGGAQVSGIANAYYRWSLTGESACSGGVWFGGSPGQVTVSGNTNTSEIAEDGSYRLTICSIDGTDVGNISEVLPNGFGDYNIDRNAPSAPAISVTNGLGNVGDGNWTTNAATSVVVAESTTGPLNQRVGPSPHTTLFCRSRTGPCTPTAGGLGFGTETLLDGVRHFAAQSSDTGGDSPIARYSINIDTEAPIHYANPADRLDWSAVSTLNIALTSSDPQKDGSNSGVQRSRYIVNQNATSPFDGACSGGTAVPGTYTNFAEGTNYIHMCTIDVAGNINTSTTDTFGYYLVDLTDPVITDNYGANDGIWQNTAQTITLTSLDAHSGTRYVRYCLGAGCTPTTLLGGEVAAVGVNTVTRSLTFPAAPPIDTILRYQSFDYAGRTSIISERSIKIENEAPTSIGTVNYHGNWDNNTNPSQLIVNFALNDTGGSQFERVQIQYRGANLDGNGGYGSFGSRGDAPGGNFTGLSGTSYSTPYNFPFENGRAVQFRIQYYDEAGNQGIDFIGTNTLLMDDNAPVTSHDHPIARDGVWQNTPVTVNFTGTDDGSGVPPGGFRYCEGTGCNPQTGTNMPASRTFSPETDTIFRFSAVDRASNLSILREFTVRIEDNSPTGSITYRNGRDNNGKHGVTAGQSIVNRTVSYSAIDTGGSGLENVTLQRQNSDTNNAGGLVGNWSAWANVPGHENTALNTNNLSRTYTQTFQNGKAVRFRLVVNDEATNDINALGYIDSANIIRMDNVDPIVADNYVSDGIWINTTQTISFTFTDNDSGIANALNDAAQNGSGRRYCIGAVGNTCNPSILLPNALSFSPDREQTMRYESTDRAGNDSTTIGSIDIFIEDNIPTGVLNYINGRDNDTIVNNRRILYASQDTGGSLLETVALQRRIADTNSDGTIGAFGAWGDALVDGPLENAVWPGVYVQPFVNGTAMQFRILLEDEAGNTNIVTSPDIMRMDNVIPTVTDDNINDTIWVNTSQTIDFTIFDEDSGVINNPVSRRYCRGIIGNTCTPSIYLPNSLTFNSITEETVRYQVTDRATNESVMGSMNVLIEDIIPTGSISYRNGRDNNGKHGVTAGQSIVNRTVSYSANDTGGSGLENVTLQRQTTTTNNAGGINAWPAIWIDVPGHENTGLNTDNLSRTYIQTFVNGTAVRFRLVVNDEATNDINALGYIDSPNVIRMDDVDPTVTDDYINDGIWINTAQTIDFTFLDNDSGIANTLSDAGQNGSGRRYCIGALGSTCAPSVYLPSSLAFSPFTSGPLGANSASVTPFDWQNTLRYESTDRAGNNSTTIGSIDILIEDTMPESALDYHDGWVDDTDPNTDRTILYANIDTGGSLLERVTLQRRTTTTNNDGSVNTFAGGWNDIVDDTGLEQGSLAGAYEQPFINRTAAQYRVRLEDEAGNIQYAYNLNGGVPVYETNPTTVPANLYILRMENEDADATFTNLDGNLSPNGWTNVTAQGIDIDFSDTGGSLLQSYTLQVSDVIDTSAIPTFANLGTPTTWANVVGHTNRAIIGENDTSTYTFTGVNKHAYMFRVMVTDIAGNSSIWIESTDTPIKIDTDFPDASDVSSITDTDLMATSVQNFVVDFDNNSGSPIIEANATFEDWSTDNTFLTTIDSSTSDNNSGVANQLDIDHSIQDVDRDREADPAGYRGYGYRITRIEDEAGNVTNVPGGSGIVTYGYRVYANSFIANIGTRSLNNVVSVTTTANIADGTEDRLIAELRDSYGNAYVRASGIGREINFNFIPTSNLFVNQYTRAGAGSVEMSTSNTPGWIDLGLLNDSNLTDLDYIPTNDGEYAFDFRAYTPTENAYSTTTSVSDPGAEFTIQTFQFAVNHTNATYSPWSTGDQSLDNGALIDFVYSPLFTTAINGDIESFGFIEGANQDSDITIQKANSTVNPNAESLVLEFGLGERLISPLLKLEVFNPDMEVPEGFSTPTPVIYETFSLAPVNSSTTFNIDSLLTMERGTTLDEIQNSYLSTHIQYTLDGKNIKYNADIIGKDNYFGNQTGGNTIQSGLKVLGQTHSGKQKDIIIDQEGKDLRVLGDIYKASLKKDIIKNAFTIIRNADPDWTFGGTSPEITDLTDFTPEINDGKSLFNSNVLYFGNDGTNARVDINTSNTNARVSGKKTILAYGRDIYIESNIYYNNNDQDILGIIALTDENGNGGNIYINPNISNIVGTMFAEKSVMSFDGVDELGGGINHEILKHQLHIFGSVFSENTIGGSRSVVLACPYYVLDSDCDQDTAQKYDMNYLRRYFTYRNGTFIVPANDGKVIGGGTCDDLGVCSGGDNDYVRNIVNTDVSIDTNSGKYAVYPVVIEYNPTGQTNPAPLFEAQ